jgi:hypothetical protein
MENNKLIIFCQDDGTMVTIFPSPDFLKMYSIDDLAKKDVPVGIPYKIISASDLPTDTKFRDAWTADMSNPHGYGIGHDAWIAEQESGK